MGDTDYGTDVAAVDDLPEIERLASGELNVGYACARRLMTPQGGLDEVDPSGQPYDSINIRDWLAGRVDQHALDQLELQAAQVLTQDPRVLSANCTATFGDGLLTLTSQIDGTDGPFVLVLAAGAAGVTTTILKAG